MFLVTPLANCSFANKGIKDPFTNDKEVGSQRMPTIITKSRSQSVRGRVKEKPNLVSKKPVS